jgi:hypothetical protein
LYFRKKVSLWNSLCIFASEAEAAAAVEESPHEVLVNDWIAGKKEVLLVAKKEAGHL